MKKYKGLPYLLLAALIFATFSIFIRELSKETTPYQQILYRNVIALLVATVALKITKQSLRSFKGSNKKILPLAISFPISVILFTIAVTKTTVASAILSLYLGSLLLSLVIDLIVYKEKLDKWRALAFCFAIAGIVVYSLPNGFNGLGLGFLLGFLAGITDALANLYRKYLGSKVDRFAMTWVNMLIGAFASVSMIFVSGQDVIVSLSGKSVAILFLFGFALVTLYQLIVRGFQTLSLNIGTIALSTELFFGILLAYLFYAESPSGYNILGGMIILGAQLFVVKASHENEK